MDPNKEPMTQYVYFNAGGESEFSEVPEDVYYVAEDGRTYKRFYKGQQIPNDIWNSFFGKNQELEEEVPKSRKRIVKSKK